jgi:hypothetical protein
MVVLCYGEGKSFVDGWYLVGNWDVVTRGNLRMDSHSIWWKETI